MSRFARFLLILFLGFTEASPALAARERMSAEDAYSLGLRYLKRGYYQKALEQFQRVRTYFRDDPYALKAELAIADLHFKKNEWDSARLAYEDFMRAHPRYKDLRSIIVTRIATEGSASQKTKLAPFVVQLQAADNGVP